MLVVSRATISLQDLPQSTRHRRKPLRLLYYPCGGVLFHHEPEAVRFPRLDLQLPAMTPSHGRRGVALTLSTSIGA